MADAQRTSPEPISVEEHLEQILAALRPSSPRRVPLADALGLVLAEDSVAEVDVPGFDNSAMDGYAVRAADLEGARDDRPIGLQVIADLPAGSSENPNVGEGQAARIMTGAPVPGGADCIVPVEHTDGGTGTVLIRQPPAPAAHIRRRGADVRRGGPVLTAGRRLTSRDLSAAAATGLSHLLVHPAPRVGVLATGSELRQPGESLARGQIHDSNSTLLAAAVREAGGIPVHIATVPDNEEALHEAFTAHADEVDAFITSGGVSVGAYDVVKAVLAPLGVWFGPVRMQPGKPQGFGSWLDGTPIFALPGNPVSACVSFEVFVRPALRALQSHGTVLPAPATAAVDEGWHSPRGRTQYMPVAVWRDATGAAVVRPATSGGSGSYLVASLAGADGLAIVEEDRTEVQTGDHIALIEFDGGRSTARLGQS